MRLSWLLLFSLAACSPYSFSKEVADLSAGVDQLSSGFTSGFSALAADRAAKTQLELTGSRARVHVASACLDQEERTAPCELHELGTAEPTLSGVEQLRGKTMSAVAVLRNYAHALAAVTNAADRTAYEAAVAQLSGSVGVTAVGTAPPGGDSPIATVTKSLGEGLGALSEARQEVLIAEAQILAGRLVPSLSDTDYRQGLSDAQAVVAVLDGLRQADPEAAARALVTAHDALLAAVNDPRRNYASLLQAALATAAELEKAAAKKES
jgi:hypothetical protein